MQHLPLSCVRPSLLRLLSADCVEWFVRNARLPYWCAGGTAVCLSLLACSAAETYSDSATWSTDTLGSYIRIGVVDGDGRYVIDRPIVFRQLSDGRYLLAEFAGVIRLFDSKGEYVRHIGRRGRGPGEFEQLANVFVTEADIILAYDYQGARITHFDTTGTVIEEVALDHTFVWISLTDRFADGRFLGWSAPPVAGANGNTVVRLERDMFVFAPTGVLVDSLGTLTLGSTVVSGSGGSFTSFALPITASGLQAIVGDQLVIAENDASTLAFYKETDEGAAGDAYATSYPASRGSFVLQKVVVLPHPCVDHLLQADIDSLMRRYEAVSNVPARAPALRLIRSTLENEQVPCYRGIQIDRADNIWLRRTTTPLNGLRPYTVVSSDGELLGDALLPADLAVTEIGRDYVLGFQRDTNGVAYAVRLRLLR